MLTNTKDSDMTNTIADPQRYKFRVTDGPGQPARVYTAGPNLDAVKADAERIAAVGYIGGEVAVIDSTIEHPERNVVHVARRRR
jgi:hypothetical protein